MQLSSLKLSQLRLRRPSKGKLTAFTQRGFNSKGALLLFYQLFNDAKPNTCAFYRISAVQRLKDAKNLLMIGRVDTWTIIYDVKNQLSVTLFQHNLNLAVFSVVILNSVTNQIAEDLM